MARPFPFFGRAPWRKPAPAPLIPNWLDGERVEEPMAHQPEAEGEDCVLCGGLPDSESLPHGRVRLILTVCQDHVQLAARRTLSRKFAELAGDVREKIER